MSSRQLAAIMFTDIAGYTALMQENEQAGIAMRQRHREVFQKEHKNYHGEVLQYYGDGTLSIFKSAVEAIQCAISMQQQFGFGVPVPLRIGIHLGDIIFDKNDVYGDGVNLASRIESLGIPGAVLISDRLNDAVKNQSSISSKSMGYFELKNVKEPAEVFCITNEGLIIPDRSSLKGKTAESQKSIAVLPFVNMSADADNEYFSDGITEEILNALVRIKGIRVTARTSSFGFKDKNLDVREVGAQLGVSHLLEGSVRKSGDRVRITAQLVSTADGYHFFSETYDRVLGDIFSVQDEIATSVSNRLRLLFGEAQHRQPLVKPPTLNMEAYETYLRGLYYFNQWGDEAMKNGIPFFEKAIAMDENFALPHAKIGVCYMFQAFGGKISWEEARNKALVHFQRAGELEMEIPESYFALFAFHVSSWNWPAAVAVVKKGLEIFPNHAPLHHALATLYYISGDTAKIISAHSQGLALDPMSMEMILFMGVGYVWHHEFEKAAIYLDKVLQMVPNHRASWEYKGWIAAFNGEYDKALEIFQQKMEPAMGYRLHRSTCLGWVYFKQGKIEEAEKCASEMMELVKGQEGFSLDLATLYTCFNDFDKAFFYLENAVRHKVGDIMMCRADPFFEPLREDERFVAIDAMIGEVPLMIHEIVMTDD